MAQTKSQSDFEDLEEGVLTIFAEAARLVGAPRRPPTLSAMDSGAGRQPENSKARNDAQQVRLLSWPESRLQVW